MKDNYALSPRTAGLLLLFSLLMGGCGLFGPPVDLEPSPGPDSTALPGPIPETTASPSPPSTQAPPPGPEVPGAAVVPVFALYQEPVVDAAPGVGHEPIATDLSNVRIPLVLSQAQLDRLARDGFVVSPGADKEFFGLYEQARYSNEPIFVTSDSLLHVYHLLFDKVLRTTEVDYLIPLLRGLNQSLLAQTDAQYQALKGTPWEEAALRTTAFVGVASRLLDPDAQVPAFAADLVNAELALVDAAAGIQPSPLFPGLEFGEDYTQYIPRGHYTRSDELKAYFRSMMWYGRMTFRLKGKDPEVGRAETRSALLLVYALRHAQVAGQPAVEAWEALYSPTVFFVGRSDDLNMLQYAEVMDAVYGADPALGTVADDALLDAFIAAADKLPPPKILGIVIMDTDDEAAVTKGLRFMGQRFVPDAYVFRQLIYRNVGTQEDRRGLPKGLDILAAMGSERAYQHLDTMGETAYANYPAQMQKMQDWLGSVTVAEWTETLYNAWLYSFYPLLEVPGEGYPAFMRSPAWLDKQLNTTLGSWAELKHDTILYAKQVYAEMGGGPPPPPPLPPRGYVEPVPAFYARLLALTTMTRTGLEARGLLSDLDRASLERLETLVASMQRMAEKELRGEPLTEEEYELIRYYGGELEHLTMAAADSDTDDPFAPRFMDEEPQAAVVADVATDPDHNADGVTGLAVLEEAVGRINQIFVVVPIVEADGTTYLQVAKGGTFSYYEFVWPGNDRLTDEKWQAMLDAGGAPAFPAWMDSFFSTDGEFTDLDRAILDFQKALIQVYWQPEYALPLQMDALKPFAAEIEGLVADRQYISHQLVRTQVRSFDLQSPELAVVTVREFWEDMLYTAEGDFPNADDPVAGRRSLYELDVTYTLVRAGPQTNWQVSQAVYASQPPVWE